MVIVTYLTLAPTIVAGANTLGLFNKLIFRGVETYFNI